MGRVTLRDEVLEVHSKNIDWNDLRHALALAQHQTMAAAAAALRIHQTTLSRRISVLEQRLQTARNRGVDPAPLRTGGGMRTEGCKGGWRKDEETQTAMRRVRGIKPSLLSSIGFDI